MGCNRNDIFGQMPVATIQVDTSKSNEERSYLIDRLRSVRDTKHSATYSAFEKPSKPSTVQQLIDAIKGDKFTIDTKRLERIAEEWGESEEQVQSQYGAMHFFKWTDYPGTDEKAKQAALKALDVEFTKAKDIISVMDATQGLAALQAFEAYVTPTA